MRGGKMAKKRKDHAILIEYAALGTISIEELCHAIIEDLHALRDNFNVKYVTGVRLRVPATNEYGDPLRVRRESGASISRIDTHHYRPACMDYDR